MQMVLLTGIAGMAGTLARFGSLRLLSLLGAEGMWGTLTVNTAGSFCTAFLFVLSRAKFPQYSAYFPLIFVGFLGAFTTFSTFALENIRFITAGQTGRFLLNFALQNGAGAAAAAAGWFLAGCFAGEA